MLAVCFFPAGFAALSMIGPPQFRNIAISMSIPGAFLIGGGAIPAGMGMMADAGHFSAAVVLTGLLIGGGSLLTLLLKSNRTPPT
jgi:NNP family nitrate/nitrite transporter-like MFS transporter